MLARTALRLDTGDEELDTLSRVQQTLVAMPEIKRPNVMTDLISDHDLVTKMTALREFTRLLAKAPKNPSPAYAKDLQYFWGELRTEIVNSGCSERRVNLYLRFVASSALTLWSGIGACGESSFAFLAAYLAQMQEDELGCIVDIAPEHAWAEVRKVDGEERPMDVIPEKWATGEADEPVAVFRQDAHYPLQDGKYLGVNIPQRAASRIQKDIQNLLGKLKEEGSPAQAIFDRLVTKNASSKANQIAKDYLESGLLVEIEGLYVSAPSAFSEEFRERTHEVLDGSSPPLSSPEEVRLDNALAPFGNPVLPKKKANFTAAVRSAFNDIAHKRATVLELKGLTVAERLGMPAAKPSTAKSTARWMTDSMKRAVLGKPVPAESAEVKTAFDVPEIRLAKNLIGRLREIEAGRTRDNALKRLKQGGEAIDADSDTEARVQNLLAQDRASLKNIFARLDRLQKLNNKVQVQIVSELLELSLRGSCDLTKMIEKFIYEKSSSHLA